jgi:hypothetical protein
MLARSVALSVALFGGAIGIAAAIDQFVSSHGTKVTALIILAVLAFLVGVGAYRARVGMRRNLTLIAAAGAMIVFVVFAFTTSPGTVRPPVVTATVQQNDSICQTFEFQSSITALKPIPTTDDDYVSWARRHDAIDVTPYFGGGQTRVLITVKGGSDVKVRITDLKFNVEKRVVGGVNGVVVQNGCGGETVARFARVDLDRIPPVIVESSAKTVTWGSQDQAVTPLRFPYFVTNKETESLLIMAESKNYVRWTAAMSYTDGERTGELRIDDHGRPFQTGLPGRGSAHYVFAIGKGLRPTS